MAKYGYGRIEKLAQNLELAGVPQAIFDEIMAGGADITAATPPVKKADWLREAMLRMDRLLPREQRHAVREGCACCLGGKRLETVKAIAKQGGTLEERVAAANEARLVFGNSVTLQEDGQVVVRFWPEGAENLRCPCLPQATAPLPITYCYCCGGHVKHHLSIALGRKLSVQVRSSVLSSGGKLPCTFLFQIQEN